MRPEDIFEAISDISDENIEVKPKKRKIWRRVAAMAAVIALVIGVVPRFIGGKAGQSGTGLSEAAVFMSYAGPVFPLSTLETGLQAERNITWDFSPYTPRWITIDDEMAELSPDLSEAEREEARQQYEEWYPEGGYWRRSSDALVSDSYTLNGEGKYTLVYPFVSSFYHFEEDAPVIAFNGQEIDYEVYADELTDGYSMGDVDGIYSWTDCKTIVESGSLEKALSGLSGMEDTPVIVYRLENIVSPDESEENINPTLEVQFDLDYDKTHVLSYGFSGGSYDPPSGHMERNDSVGYEKFRNDPRMLIVLGHDIENLTIHGYKTGAAEAGNELEGISADIVRTESTLGEVMRECVSYYVQSTDGFETEIHDKELFYSVAMRVLAFYGDFERFFEGLGSMFTNVRGSERIFYAVCEVDVSAGDVLTAACTKEASFDYHCANTKNKGLNGYDMVTRLGSTIDFAHQTAEIVNFDDCEIVNQNMGLDLEKGITKAELDLNTEHYYLEVRAKTK